MKKSLLLFAGCLLMSTFLMAQAPKLFNYQGIVHGSSGPLINQTIALKISIIDSASNGAILYSERQVDTTNNFGLYAVAIGAGTTINGNMATIDWSSNDKYIKLAIDPTGGTSYTILGTTQLLSVPYAMYAENSPSDTNVWSLNGNIVVNTAFIGTLNDEDIRFKRNGIAIGKIESNNIVFGENAFSSNTLGINNNALGDSALFNNKAGKNNNAFGGNTLSSNTHGVSNNALGNYALFSNTIGYSNNALGNNALYSNTQGGFNNALGVDALYSNTVGISNNALGNNALYSNTSGRDNNALGIYTLNSNTIGVANNAVGGFALRYNTTGDYNNAIGKYALNRNTTGDYNNAIGYNAGITNTTGSYLTIAGSSADVNDTNYTKSGAFGYNSIITASNQYRIGAATGTSSIGGRVGWTTVSDGRFKTDVKENVVGLAFVEKLRPVTYHFDNQKMEDFIGMDRTTKEGEEMPEKAITEDAAIYSGFIAQEVEATAEKLGYDFHGVDQPKNDKDYYGLRYAEFVVPLVKAVQEQQEMIEAQRKLIEKQNNRINNLENQNSKIISQEAKIKKMEAMLQQLIAEKE